MYLFLSCPNCGGTSWTRDNVFFRCDVCGLPANTEEMVTKASEENAPAPTFGRWLRPKGSTRGSYKFQCSLCGNIVHQVTGNNGRKVKEDNPQCTYAFCPWCQKPMREE